MGRECFSMFDEDGEGIIRMQDFGVIMRSLSANPTEAALADMINEVDAHHNGVIDFSAFLCLMGRTMQDTDTEEDMLEAFKAFDPNNTGYVSTADFTHAMTSLDENLTAEEIHEIVNEPGTVIDGRIH